MTIFEVINCLGAGGAETLLKDLSIEFQEKNHKVIVITLDQFSDDISEKKKLNILQSNGILCYSLGRKPGQLNFNVFFKIRNLLNKYKPNVIHIHSFLAGLHIFPFSISKKYQFYQTIHNTHIFDSSYQKIVFSTIYKYRYKNIFCSEESFNSLNKKIGWGPVINNGIPNLSFSCIRSKIEDEFNIPRQSFIGLNVGRITQQKNHLLLLDLVEELNKKIFLGSFYMLICGKNFNDNLYNEINKKRNSLTFKENIKFIGVRNDVLDLMHSVDIYISTSIHEGLPITVLEALRTGVPVLISPIAEHINVFSHVAGCFIPNKNEVTNYLELINETKELKELSKQNLIKERQDIISKYDIKNTANSYINHFNKTNLPC